MQYQKVSKIFNYSGNVFFPDDRHYNDWLLAQQHSSMIGVFGYGYKLDVNIGGQFVPDMTKPGIILIDLGKPFVNQTLAGVDYRDYVDLGIPKSLRYIRNIEISFRFNLTMLPSQSPFCFQVLLMKLPFNIDLQTIFNH